MKKRNQGPPRLRGAYFSANLVIDKFPLSVVQFPVWKLYHKKLNRLNRRKKMNNRVTFEIAGIGTRMNGVSKKNNKPYDFTPVSLLYESSGFTGRAAVTLNLNAEQVAEIKDFCVGGIFEAVVYFDAYRRMNLAYIF